VKKRRARLRPKVRQQRRSIVTTGMLGLAAFIALVGIVKVRPWQYVELPQLQVPLPAFTAVNTVELVGAPSVLIEQIRERMQWTAGMRWGLLQAGRVGARISTDFSCVRRVRSRRSWARKEVTFELLLRRPVARITDAGKNVGFLSASGIRFTAPEHMYEDVGLPQMELGGLPQDANLAALARLMAAAGVPGTLPARLTRWSYVPDEAGWTGVLANGTQLVWGKLRWTDEKLRRLQEVLADAGPRFGAAFTADLRHFEDGKILVRKD
jgi:hypothetical protein